MPGHFPTIPIAVPMPGRLVLFAPHPDDIAISLGALAAWAAGRVPVTIALMTDGSEARLPDRLADRYAARTAPPEERRRARGRIRVQEALMEAMALGFDASAVRLLERQTWFSAHCTPAECLHDDLSLRNVDGFVPGPIDGYATSEIRRAIGAGDDTICAVPDPDDRLIIHRITTQLVGESRGNAHLLTYECLSTIEVTGPQTAFGFDEELMGRKCQAILAHESMRERRRQFGGYTNPGTEFYDAIVRRKNAALARELGLPQAFAERFGWAE